MASVADFLIERLFNAGLKHIFGVRGPFIDDLQDRIAKSNLIQLVLHDDENQAALAADAYARVSGIGCVCVDYNVGALKACNAVAASYAERSPLILISGSPAIKERNDDVFFHHVVKNFDNQLRIFKALTCYSSILDDPTTAGLLIDQALESLVFKKQPVYVELPLDISTQPLRYDVYRQGTPLQSPTNEENLTEAFAEISQLIEYANSPLIMAGVQIKRFNLGDQLVRFAEKHEIPIAATLLSKSFVSENHRLFSGVFSGKDFSTDQLNDLIDKSDCLLVLGDLPTDLNFGFHSLKFSKKQMALCSAQVLKIRNHSYKDINFKDFCLKLFKTDFKKKERKEDFLGSLKKDFAATNQKITLDRFFEKVSQIISEDISVISDSGKILKYTHRLKTGKNQFLSSAFYSTKDFVIPAVLGFGLAKSESRILAFVNSKGFQTSAFGLQKILKNNLNPIIFVLSDSNEEGTDLINCEKIIDLISNCVGFRVETEDELCSNIDLALKSKQASVIHVVF